MAEKEHICLEFKLFAIMPFSFPAFQTSMRLLRYLEKDNTYLPSHLYLNISLET